MAIDNRLQVFNEEGQPVDYDILASDVKFNDGKDLPTKLAEMETQIGEAGKVKSVSVNNGTPAQPDSNGNVNINVQGGGLTKEDFSVETQGDGTVDINVGSGANKDTYTINLNHTHENMAKLIVCEESDLPSTLDPATIYAITDSGETEIEKLIIRGMEFAGGGGTSSTEPKIVSPIGTQLDFNGESAKTVTVRATNLSEALTIAVSGVTASLQTISAKDAANGVQLTLTKIQNFVTGTLRIYSSEVDKSWTVIESQDHSTIAAVKFTGTQWIDTGYTPGPDTSFELDCKFEPNTGTNSSTSSNSNCAFLHAPKATESFMFQTGYSDATLYSLMMVTDGNNTLTQHEYGESAMKNVRGIISYTNGSCTYLGYTFNPLSKSALSNGSLKLAYNSGKSSHPIFDVFNLYVYGFKIYNSGTLVRDFKPRLSNNVAGLYDVVNGVFYTSETSSELEAVNS